MRFNAIRMLAAAAYMLSASAVFAQAIGEYGRAVGNVPHGKTVTGSKGTGRTVSGKPGKSAPGAVAVPEGRALPTQLVVTVNEARLYPRQDEESEKIDLSDEIAFFIAKHLRSNVRELEGALKKVLAFARFSGRELSLELTPAVISRISSPR